MKRTILISVIGLIFYLISLVVLSGSIKPNVKKVTYISPTKHVPGTISPKFPLPGKDTAGVWEVLGTYYNPVPNQCDASPFITADGSKINKSKLKKEEIKWVALSRDLLSRWGGPFNYGDTLYVHHTNTHVRGIWIVHDSMNARFRKRMDFLRWRKGKFPGKANNVLISTKPFYNKR